MRWVALLFACGCYSPHAQPGSPCAANGACPSGLVCSPATGTCELDAVDATQAMPDSPVQPPIDAPTAIDGPEGPPPAKLVQEISAQSSNGASITAELKQPPTPGHLLVMVGGNPAQSLTDVSGGAATWTRLGKSTVNTNVEVWVGVATDGIDVTITALGADAPNTLWVGELSHASADVDVTATDASGEASPAAPPPIVTTAFDVAILGISDGVGNDFGPLPGFEEATPIVGGSIVQSVWFANVGPGDALTPTVDETSHHWDAVLAVVKRQ